MSVSVWRSAKAPACAALLRARALRRCGPLRCNRALVAAPVVHMAAEYIEAVRIEAGRTEAAHIEAEYTEAECTDVEHIEAECTEVEDIEAERTEVGNIEAARTAMRPAKAHIAVATIEPAATAQSSQPQYTPS